MRQAHKLLLTENFKIGLKIFKEIERVAAPIKQTNHTGLDWEWSFTRTVEHFVSWRQTRIAEFSC